MTRAASIGLRKSWACAAILLALAIGLPAPTRADILQRGQLAVSGFSGFIPGASTPDGAVIDVKGPVLRVLDVSQLGASAQNLRFSPAIKFKVSSGEIGQVFGLVLDDGRLANGQFGVPNIYLAATSAYGLRIISGNSGAAQRRLSRGQADAAWMKGQFGTEKGGGPGSIWKVDGRSGQISLLANIQTGGLANSGPGLGGIAFDPGSRMLYVADLQTGLIHRLDLNGTDLGYFDHGVEGRPLGQLASVPYAPEDRREITDSRFEPNNPETWGFARRERLVHGISVHLQRLFYAVADGAQIWSVGLNADGSFAGDARVEIAATGTPDDARVTEIAFDASGRLYLAERAAPGKETSNLPSPSVIRRFEPAAASGGVPARWTLLPDDNRSDAVRRRIHAAGGVALGFGMDANGVLDPTACDGTLWSTTTPLRGLGAPGQGQSTGLGLRADDLRAGVAAAPQPYFIADDEVVANLAGNAAPGAVKSYSPCPASQSAAVPPVNAQDRGPRLFIQNTCKPCPVGGSCSCRVTIVNRGGEAPKQPVGFSSGATILSGPLAGSFAAVSQSGPDARQWTCRPRPNNGYDCFIDGAQLRPGARRYVDLLIETEDLAETGNIGLRQCARLQLQGGEIDGQESCTEIGADIAVALAGPNECVAGAPCSATATITNLTNVLFDGEINLDVFAAVPGQQTLAGNVTIKPPLDCKPQPANSSIFECLTRLSLRPGETRTYEIIATYLGDGTTDPIKAVQCAVAADAAVDINKLLPGLPPAPLEGPGYSCRALTLLPEGSRPAGGGPGQGPGGAPGGGGGTPSPKPQEKPISCPTGMIAQGTQCYCPRGSRWESGRCLTDDLDAKSPTCADGGSWNGVKCLPPDVAGGSKDPTPISCRAPLQSGRNGCACPEKSKWNGLTCAAQIDYAEKPDSTGPGPVAKSDQNKTPIPKLEPCPEGQVRDANGKCACPPYLETISEAGKIICCLVPCPEGTERVNAVCIAKPVAAAPQCPAGWSGSFPVCCAPGALYQNGRCQRVASLKCEGGMIGTPPNCYCPEGQRYDAGRRQCMPIPPCTGGMIGEPPNCRCPDGQRLDPRTRQCVAIPSCTGGMIGTPPNCQCPDGQRLDPRTRQCTPIPSCTGGMIGTPPNCQCPDGQRLDPRTRQCAPIPSCTGGMVGTPPNCQCPDGQRLNPRTRQCAPIPSCTGGMVGTPPNCQCPDGQRLNPRTRQCAPIPSCTGGMIGEPPNCRCPDGQRLDPRTRQCVAIPSCTGGMVGTPPNCQCPDGQRYDRRQRRCMPIECPAGYRVLPKPNQSGSYCELIPPTSCTGGMVGTPPNCACPSGNRFDPRRRRCMPITCPDGYRVLDKPNQYGAYCELIPKPTVNCTGGQIGTPPNCTCPGGTRFDRRQRRCVPITCPAGYRVLDKPNQYGAYCELIPQATQCTGGRVGTPPNCTCPPGTRFMVRLQRCIRISQPAPQKCEPYQIGTWPACRCPPRLTGPKCDQPIVN